MAVPPGWIARESIVVAAPEQAGYIRVASNLLPSELTIEEFANACAKQLCKRLPGYEELAVETVQLVGGQPALLRSFRWTPPERDARAELHLYAVRGQRGILARAISSAAHFAEVEPTFRELLLGISGGTPASRGGVLRTESTSRERTYAAFEAGRLTTTRERAFGIGTSNGEHEAEGAER